MNYSIFPSYKYVGISHPQKTILVSVSKFAEGFLRFAPRTIRNYPSHGVDHSVNIIRMINDFTEKWGIKLSKNERFILYSAAWLHDIGCVKNRSPHNKISVDILLKNESICNSFNSLADDLLIDLQDVIESHSSTYNINEVVVKRGSVRVQLICAIFRLIDACEITNFKCPASVFTEIKDDLKKDDGTIDKEAVAFWKGHMNIKYIGFFKPEIVITLNFSRKSQKIINRLKIEIISVQRIFRTNRVDVPVIQVRSREAGIDK
jgi:hypothetical protein